MKSFLHSKNSLEFFRIWTSCSILRQLKWRGTVCWFLWLVLTERKSILSLLLISSVLFSYFETLSNVVFNRSAMFSFSGSFSFLQLSFKLHEPTAVSFYQIIFAYGYHHRWCKPFFGYFFVFPWFDVFLAKTASIRSNSTGLVLCWICNVSRFYDFLTLTRSIVWLTKKNHHFIMFLVFHLDRSSVGSKFKKHYSKPGEVSIRTTVWIFRVLNVLPVIAFYRCRFSQLLVSCPKVFFALFDTMVLDFYFC